MLGSRSLAVSRFGFALLTIFAITTQFRGMLNDPFKSTVMFFSEFTYQSNVLVAAVLLLGAAFLWTETVPREWWDLIRGAIVTYTTTTLIVYQLLVKGTRPPEDGISYYEQWASDALHVWIPLFILADWLLAPPQRGIPIRRALLWTIYPLLFLGYSLIRGPIVDWYPYNFIDPVEVGGWGWVAAFVLGISAGFLTFSLVVVIVGNAARRLHWSLRPAPATAG